MSDPLLEEDDAATPLTAEEREGLIPSYVTLRRELNEAEQANILEAEEWAFARKRKVLDERFLTDLHKRMFGRVWRWAGASVGVCTVLNCGSVLKNIRGSASRPLPLLSTNREINPRAAKFSTAMWLGSHSS